MVNKNTSLGLAISTLALFLAGCEQGPTIAVEEQLSAESDQRTETVQSSDPVPQGLKDVIWALNLGGPAYEGVDGVKYLADSGTGGTDTLVTGEPGAIESARATQDPLIYQSYRRGPVQVSREMPNGRYSITFKFAEPEDIPVGSRVFDVWAEDTRIIAALDVRLARDNNHHSALVRTVADVEVTDGKLDIRLEAERGDPVLSAVVVRRAAATDDGWQLIWSDEFAYSGRPDPARWNVDVWPARKVNGEDQAYTARAKNLRVENGVLVLEAHREASGDAQYTSARVHSQGFADFLYGRAEIRARLAPGQGTWSAIWMLPSDPYRYSTTCAPGEDWQGSLTCDAWPNSGEIDIMEHVGYDMGTIHATVHTLDYYFMNGLQRKSSILTKNVAEDFHIYAIEWSPQRIDIFVDGVRYFTYTNDGTGWKSWPFDHPYHLVLNLAIGGDWGRAGGPIDDSIFPARMEVDFVRVFQRMTGSGDS